jgi:hypothetical protein
MQLSQDLECVGTLALSHSHQGLFNSFHRENTELQQLLHAVDTHTCRIDLSLQFNYESAAVFYGVYTANNSGLIGVQHWYRKFTKRIEVLGVRVEGARGFKVEDEGSFKRRLELIQAAADDVGRVIVNLEMKLDALYRMNAGLLERPEKCVRCGGGFNTL